jgi:hypothetical protein
LGDNTGHLWAFVQSIKPPTLIELYGPMFMSFAVANNIIVRFEPTDSGTRVTLRHQILGVVSEDYNDNIGKGWGCMLEHMKKSVEK